MKLKINRMRSFTWDLAFVSAPMLLATMAMTPMAATKQSMRRISWINDSMSTAQRIEAGEGQEKGRLHAHTHVPVGPYACTSALAFSMALRTLT
jgi:hypothetical protein